MSYTMATVSTSVDVKPIVTIKNLNFSYDVGTPNIIGAFVTPLTTVILTPLTRTVSRNSNVNTNPHQPQAWTV